MCNNVADKAIFIPEGAELPPKAIINSPELQVYVDRFGELKDDWGLGIGVQKANYAAKMYKKLGFEIAWENEEEFIMICAL